MINQGITSLDTGAPNITYTGNEGVKSPEQEQQMMMAQLQEEYDKYVFEMEEQGIQPMSIEQFIEQIMAEGQMSSKGPVLPNDPTEPVNPFQPKPIGPVLPDRQMAAFGGIMGLDQRKQYGIGSKFKRAFNKVTKPFTKLSQKLMPRELAGIAQFAAPFAGPYAPLLYAAGAAKQRGKINPMMLAMMAAPYARMTPGEGLSYGTAANNPGSYGLRDLITGGGRGSSYTGESLFDKVGAGDYGLKTDEFIFGKPRDVEFMQPQGPTKEVITGSQDPGTIIRAGNIPGQNVVTDATSGLIGKGGEMYQALGGSGDVGIADTIIGQKAFLDAAGDPSMLKLGSWAIGIVSGIKAGKYKDEQDAADAAEAAALAADSEASEATLQAARDWAIETFGSMSVYADGGRIGFASGTKDPSDVIEGMDNELNPGIIDSILKGVDKDHGYRLIHEIQDYKYGGTDSLEQPPMSMEETIKALEAKWDAEIKQGMEPGSYNDGFMYFQDMGIYNKEDIRRRVELGYDSAKGPESSEGIMTAADGGRINKNMGGEFNMPPAGLSSLQTQQSDVTPQGMELDLRGGGFIPIGKAEKADDVPARVSKNEFVFTADAVKAAGGGSVNEGAKRMYDTMKRLESQVG